MTVYVCSQFTIHLVGNEMSIMGLTVRADGMSSVEDKVPDDRQQKDMTDHFTSCTCVPSVSHMEVVLMYSVRFVNE